MKKINALIITAMLLFVVACGPSAKELEQARIADSTRIADSCAIVLQAEILKAKIADSLRQDSLLKIDIAKKAQKKANKKRMKI